MKVTHPKCDQCEDYNDPGSDGNDSDGNGNDSGYYYYDISNEDVTASETDGDGW